MVIVGVGVGLCWVGTEEQFEGASGARVEHGAALVYAIHQHDKKTWQSDGP